MKTNFNSERSGQRVWRTALYLRLSREDGDRRESDSISNQRKLIQDYVEDRSEFCITDEYIDDGWSGSNFDRPGWKGLYEDLESGAVNCIIVKDLSRFGRNYIEVGRYLQMIFPVLGVRLVAINDNYDTLKEQESGDALMIPVKNLINDIYCRDISKKVTTQLKAMRKRGECVASFLPYGYVRNPKDHSKLIVDKAVAENIKHIFVWKLEGYSNKAIAQRLNEEGVLSPYEYRVYNGENRVCGFKRKEKAVWSGGSVYRVLRNEYYKGTMVQGKCRKLDYRSKVQVRLPKEEWTRVEGTHEAIVEPELFNLVQEMMEKETRTVGNGGRVELLSGFLYCGECGRQLTLKPSYYKGKKYRYYNCRDCADEGRKSKRVRDVKAYNKILEAILKTAEMAAYAEAARAEGGVLPKKSRESLRLEGQTAGLQAETERYEELKRGLYADYIEGILSREEYIDFSQIYSAKIDKAKEALRKTEEKRRKAEADCKEARWIKKFKKYENLESLNRPVLAELVEKVFVYEGGRIEVVFKDKASIEAAAETFGFKNRGKEGETDEILSSTAERAEAV